MMSWADLKRRCAPKAVTVLSSMVFWGQMQNYMMRLNLSILIVDMVKEDPDGGGGNQGRN
jgi:hypothetical protein